MKKNELMIGDLVHIAGFIEPRDHAITAIKPDEFGDYFALLDEDDVWWDINCLSPIPLTPEILEKNGFYKIEHRDEYRADYEEYTITLQVGCDNANAFWWCIGDILICLINYVHQLQHALRLCGIEKEIVL